MRVVFDTNIYISALAIPGGNAEDAYLEAVRGTFELYTSVAILTETARVLQLKFDWAEDKAREAVQAISQVATALRPRPLSISSKMNRTIAYLNARSLHKPSSLSQEIAISWRSSTMQISP